MANNLFYSIGGSSGSTSIIDKYPPNPVTVLTAKGKNASVELIWTDPEDLELVDGTIIKWAYTRIVRKVGSAPADINDGTVVINSSIKNQYQNDPYVDDELVNDTTYYYVAFSISETGGINSEGPSVNATPISYKTMTVTINENETNPVNMCTYADDAVGMESGESASEWTNFFGYRPCLFKDGHVVGYLNPDDFSKFENGDPADITSGDSGDVMIEFPRRGIKISKSDNVITVSMTDNPDDPNFTYYAHTRNGERRENFSIGAYIGYATSNSMYSLSGKNPMTGNESSVRVACEARGSGFVNIPFYLFTFIQVMYLLQFKSTNYQSSFHPGVSTSVGSPSNYRSGSTNGNGMIYTTHNNAHHCKLFGLEDFAWSNGLTMIISGIRLFNNTYKASRGQFGAAESYFVDTGITVGSYFANKYVSKTAGTAEGGFLPIEGNGSSSTYYCAKVYVISGSDLGVGGDDGIFGVYVNFTSSYATGRLCYW